MKKLTSLLLAVLLLFGGIVEAFAEEQGFGSLIPVLGDADGDGKVTAADARLVLRASVGLHTPDILRRLLYDADTDGSITAADARLVLRASVGLENLSVADVILGALTNNPTKTAQDAVSRKELDRIMKELCAIGSRSIYHPENNRTARQYIVNELKAAGLKPQVQDFTYDSMPTANIYASLNNGNSNGNIIVFSAHYDCWEGAEGAVDNASGVAALLHIAKILKEKNFNFSNEIRFVFFSAEEQGYHGAYHYLGKLPKKELGRIQVFNIDMAGYSLYSQKQYLCISTEAGSFEGTAKANAMSKAVEKAKRNLGNLGETKFYSPVAAGKTDMIPFREKGIPAITLSWREKHSETSYGSDYSLSTPEITHTVFDTYENFDINSLYNTTGLIITALVI